MLPDADSTTGIAQLITLHAVASTLGVATIRFTCEYRDVAFDVGGDVDVERGHGLILTAGGPGVRQRDVILALAARHRVPGIYPYRFFATGGGS